MRECDALVFNAHQETTAEEPKKAGALQLAIERSEIAGLATVRTDEAGS